MGFLIEGQYCYHHSFFAGKAVIVTGIINPIENWFAKAVTDANASRNRNEEKISEDFS